MTDDADRITTAEAATMLGLTPATLAQYRSTQPVHRCPPYHREGKGRGRVHYLRSEIEAWIDEGKEPTQ